MSMWVWISTSYFTGGFDLDEDFTVRSAPPIAQWAVGKRVDKVLDYYTHKTVLKNFVLFRDGVEVKCEL